MIYRRIRVDTETNGSDVLCGILLDNDIDGFEIIDDIPVTNPFDFDYEELRPDIPDRGGVVSVIFYLEMEADYAPILQEIRGVLPDASISIDTSDEEDWRDKWKEYFHSFSIGDILIKPSWEEVEDTKGKLLVEIDPGVSFGTGSHETTRMCIEDLSHLDLSSKKVLDFGCGSGILSIVSEKLQSKDITCVDIDPQCIVTTRENIEKNKCNPSHFTYITGDVRSSDVYKKLPDGEYDVVLANILADIIVEMVPFLTPKLKTGGRIITSGIIEGKEDIVFSALNDAGFSQIEKRKSGEWFLISGVK